MRFIKGWSRFFKRARVLFDGPREVEYEIHNHNGVPLAFFEVAFEDKNDGANIDKNIESVQLIFDTMTPLPIALVKFNHPYKWNLIPRLLKIKCYNSNGKGLLIDLTLALTYEGWKTQYGFNYEMPFVDQVAYKLRMTGS